MVKLHNDLFCIFLKFAFWDGCIIIYPRRNDIGREMDVCWCGARVGFFCWVYAAAARTHAPGRCEVSTPHNSCRSGSLPSTPLTVCMYVCMYYTGLYTYMIHSSSTCPVTSLQLSTPLHQSHSSTTALVRRPLCSPRPTNNQLRPRGTLCYKFSKCIY